MTRVTLGFSTKVFIWADESSYFLHFNNGLVFWFASPRYCVASLHISFSPWNKKRQTVFDIAEVVG